MLVKFIARHARSTALLLLVGAVIAVFVALQGGIRSDEVVCYDSSNSASATEGCSGAGIPDAVVLALAPLAVLLAAGLWIAGPKAGMAALRGDYRKTYKSYVRAEIARAGAAPWAKDPEHVWVLHRMSGEQALAKAFGLKEEQVNSQAVWELLGPMIPLCADLVHISAATLAQTGYQIDEEYRALCDSGKVGFRPSPVRLVPPARGAASPAVTATDLAPGGPATPPPTVDLTKRRDLHASEASQTATERTSTNSTATESPVLTADIDRSTTAEADHVLEVGRQSHVDDQRSSTQPPAAWYPDPEAAHLLRYWDGAAWTEHRAPRV